MKYSKFFLDEIINVAKKIDFFSFVIYNTLMKQSFVISVNYAATTQERGEDTSQGLCL